MCVSRLKIGIIYLIQLVRVFKISTVLKQACRHYLSNLDKNMQFQLGLYLMIARNKQSNGLSKINSHPSLV